MGVVLSLKIVFSVALLFFCSIALFLYNLLWLKPQRLRSKLSSQGINGPSPSFPLGNIPEMMKIVSEHGKTLRPRNCEVSHDLVHFLFPYLRKWTDQYGRNFMLSLGHVQVLCVTDPNVAQEISLCTSPELGRPDYQRKALRPLLGNGILTSDGAAWAHQRKTIAPELYMDKIQGKVQLMVETATKLVNTWHTEIERHGGLAEINPDVDLRTFSSSLISKTLLGKSHSTEGAEIFLRFNHIQKTYTTSSLLKIIAGLGYLPTKSNREKWRLEKEIRSMILKISKDHMADPSEDDILQKIINGANKGEQGVGAAEAEEFIVDNCKNIYFGGYESSSVSALWALMLLALHPEWQARARAEVLAVCGDGVPVFNMLGQMKVLTAVVQEVLRLYPPAIFIPRETLKEMKFKSIQIPKGVAVWVSALTLHHDPEIWGADAKMFNPERFANGVLSACKVPQAYMPFGVGQHICAGQQFAMLELKVVLSLILSNFSFSLSPNYVHSPVFQTILKPQNGINLIVKRLSTK